MDCRIVYVLLVCIILFPMGLVGAYIVPYFVASGVELSNVFALTAIEFIVIAFLATFVGTIADNYGRKKNIVAGILVYGASLAFLGCFPSPQVVLLVVIFFGVGTALRANAIEAWIVDAVRHEKGTNALADTLSMGASLGLVAGVIAACIASYLATYGTPVVIRVGGILYVTGAVLAYLFVKEDVSIIRARTWKLRHRFAEGVKLVLFSRNLISYTLGFLFMLIPFYLVALTWAVILENTFLTAYLGIIFAGLTLANAAGCFISSVLMRILGHKNLLVFTSAAMQVLFIAMIFLWKSPNILILFVFWEIVWGIMEPALIFWRNLLIPPETRVTSLSTILMFKCAVSSIGLAAIGVILGRIGLNLTYLATGTAYSFSMICFFLTKSENDSITISEK